MKRLYKIILLLIIPLLIAFGIGYYAYENNTIYFLNDYIEDSGYKNTKGEMEKYLLFNSSAYEEYYTKEVTMYSDDLQKDVKLFDLTIYRVFDCEYEDGELEVKDSAFSYVYVLTNVNYGNVYYSIYERDDKQHRFEYIPTFKLEINDLDDEEDNRDSKVVDFAENSGVKLYDYNFVGYTTDEGKETKRTYSGIRITTPATRWATVAANDDFSSHIEIVVSATDAQFPNDEDATIDVLTLEFNDHNQKIKNLTYDSKKDVYTFLDKELVNGYEQDIYAAGYFEYAMKKVVWWQALIAFVLTFIVTGSTVLVWNAEVKKEQEAQNKRDKKDNRSKK